MKLQAYFLPLVALAMAGFLLFHFIMIWVYGRFYIYETNPLILVIETTMVVAVLLYCVYCLASQLRQQS